jgi:hypothetical protein
VLLLDNFGASESLFRDSDLVALVGAQWRRRPG